MTDANVAVEAIAEIAADVVEAQAVETQTAEETRAALVAAELASIHGQRLSEIETRAFAEVAALRTELGTWQERFEALQQQMNTLLALQVIQAALNPPTPTETVVIPSTSATLLPSNQAPEQNESIVDVEATEESERTPTPEPAKRPRKRSF